MFGAAGSLSTATLHTATQRCWCCAQPVVRRCASEHVQKFIQINPTVNGVMIWCCGLLNIAQTDYFKGDYGQLNTRPRYKYKGGRSKRCLTASLAVQYFNCALRQQQQKGTGVDEINAAGGDARISVTNPRAMCHGYYWARATPRSLTQPDRPHEWSSCIR